MAKIYDNILELIGHTPLVRFHALEKKFGAKAKIIGKLEFFNPSFSSKARIAKNMIEEAEKAGKIVCPMLFASAFLPDWKCVCPNPVSCSFIQAS